MKRIVKIVLGALFTIILLLMAIPLFISAETLKKEFAAQATKATGRTVDIKGKASLTLFPNIEVSIEDVTIGNAAGFKAPYLFHAKTLAAGASLKPLLAGNLNITGITLHGADIRLEELAGGATNWEFKKPGAAEETPAGTTKGKASDAIKSVAMGDVSIKDSTIIYSKPGKTVKAEQINLVVKGADGRGALIVDGGAVYQGKPASISAKVEQVRHFLAGDAAPAGIRLKLPNGTANFSGKLQAGETIAAAGKLSLDMKDIDALAKWAMPNPPKILPQQVKLDAEAKIKGAQVSLSDATVHVVAPGGVIDFTGDVRVEEQVSAAGNVALDLKDVPQLVKWATPTPPKILPKQLSLKGDAIVKGRDVSIKGADISAEVPGGTMKFNGDASYIGDVAANGKLVLAFADLPAAMQWATGKPAKSVPAGLDFVADLVAKDKVYALKSASLKAGDVSAAGDVTASLKGEVPAVSGTLKFGTLNLNTLMRTASLQPKHGWLDAYAAAPKGWSTKPIDFSGLRAVNADLSITADTLKQGNLEVSDIALRPQLAGGSLNLNIAKASLYGGTAKGTITASAGAQSVGADLDFSGIRMEPFLTALKGETHVSGTAAMQLHVKGAGASEQAIVSNLNGNGAIKVTDGAIKGMNLAQFWRDLKNGFLFGSPSQSTDFSELSGTFTIANGIVSNSDLAMKSPALRVSGSGTVNLPQRTVNYRIVPSLVATSKGQGGAEKVGVDVPLDIRGPIDNPNVVPDVAGIVQKQLENPEALKQNIKDIKETIKDYNSLEDIGGALLGTKKKAAEPAPAATTAPPATAQEAPAAPQPQTQQLTPEQQLIQGIGGLLQGR